MDFYLTLDDTAISSHDVAYLCASDIAGSEYRHEPWCRLELCRTVHLIIVIQKLHILIEVALKTSDASGVAIVFVTLDIQLAQLRKEHIALQIFFSKKRASLIRSISSSRLMTIIFR